MLICRNEDCQCLYRRFMDCLKKDKDMDREAISRVLDISNANGVTDKSGLTLLHYAVKYHSPAMVWYLITEDCNINAQDNRGTTPLMMALTDGPPLTAELLLKCNACIYGVINMLQSVVYRSLSGDDKDGYQKVLKLFFDQVNRNFLKEKQRMALLLLFSKNIVKFAAVVFCNVELAKILLDNGYPIDFQEPITGHTALHWCIMSDEIENAKMLIEHGANINALNSFKYSPLYYYSIDSEFLDKNANLLDMLLKHSVIPTVPDIRYGITFIEHLVTNFGKQTVRAVLKNGIDVAWYSYEDKSLLDQLVENKYDDVIDLLEELDIKFNVNARAPNGDTPLMRATRIGSLKKVEFLLKHGADVHSCFNDETALLYATNRTYFMNMREQMAYAKIIELLLRHGADAQLVYNENEISIIDTYQTYQLQLSAKIVVAHLALLLALENVFTYKELDTNMKSHLALCSQQLEEMKYIKVHGILTLFQLLSEKEERVTKLARNQQFISAFDSTIEDMPRLDSYYRNTLCEKIANAIDKNKLYETAAGAIALLTGICSKACWRIVYDIICYLNLQDLLSLSKVQN